MRSQISNRLMVVLAISTVSALLMAQTPNTHDDEPHYSEHDRFYFRSTGLCQRSAHRKDPALLPQIEEILQSAKHLDVRYRHGITVDALVAVGRIGTERALAVLEQFENLSDYPGKNYYLDAYVPVIKARIRADLEFPAVRTPQQWEEKVALFLQEAQLMREALATALKNHPQFGDPMVYPSRGVVAVRVLLEMADEAYASGVKSALELFQGLDLARDYPSWLRYQLVPLTKRERIAWLVDSLSRKPARRFLDRYELLALWQCGVEVVPVIIEQIERLLRQEPRGEQEHIQRNVGVVNLTEVLAGFEDSRVEPFLERLVERDGFKAKAKRLLYERRAGLRGILIYDW
ncbi:MAG: hypothetical protein ACUVV1_03465 [Fimbriimonadales bacterium]